MVSNRRWVLTRERLRFLAKVAALILITFAIGFLLTRVFINLFSAGWR